MDSRMVLQMETLCKELFLHASRMHKTEAASGAGTQAQPGGDERLLATATGIFKKLGALRAL